MEASLLLRERFILAHPKGKAKQGGYTLVELVVVMTLTLVLSVAFYSFFKTNLFTYLNLQKDASSFTGLAYQSQRLATVVRGATSIVSIADNDLVIYAYFYPSDVYVSIVHYYLNATSTILYADVTPMSANPPIGTPITASKKTYTIISNYKQIAGIKLFEYLDDTGTTMTLPIADLHTIKGITINLAVPTAIGGGNESTTLQVNLRNRKNNL